MYLDEIREALEDQVEEIETLLYGGSVAKHTYVDGLSDIDSLVIIAATAHTSPQELREDLAEALRSTLGPLAKVSVGDMAVSVEYRDGTVIQLLPAIRDDQGLAISSPKSDSWKRIEPERFAKRLTEVNGAVAGNAVPVIKLAKSALRALPETDRPSGYHVEALAIAAFDGYKGSMALKDMLAHLFTSAAENVSRPIKDVTRQSPAVDEYLGRADSPTRGFLRNNLLRLARKLENARSVDEWRDLVNPD
jgi:predicted nucleotidyltransferase